MADDSSQLSLRERKKAETRDRLAAAAVARLLEVGPESTTIAAIAEKANVSPRTFHNYFDNREEAYLHFCTEYVLQTCSFIDQLPPELGPLDALEESARHAHSKSDNALDSLATLSYVAEQLRVHFGQIAQQQGKSSAIAVMPLEGKDILDPLIRALEKRSDGRLSTFHLLFLTGCVMTLIATLTEPQYCSDAATAFQGKSEQELMAEGFNLLRHGFDTAENPQ